MYCNKCGHKNVSDAKFCQKCGSKIETPPTEQPEKHTQIETDISEDTKESAQASNKIKPGLEGWLALVGLGLIVSPFITGYALLGYFPLFNQTYNAPGLNQSIQFEFVMLLAFFLLTLYLLYLYFKKSVKFPKYYIIYLISFAIYSIIDYAIVSSIAAQSQALHKEFASAISDGVSTMDRAIFGAIIWVWYMITSKRVKATFTKK